MRNETNTGIPRTINSLRVGLLLAAFAAMLFATGVPLIAQVNPQSPSGSTQNSMPQSDQDTTRGELARMDQFLDSHPEVAEQLRKDPSLVNNKEFLENHPALQQFLQEHPQVREEFQENPSTFMRRENRFDRNEDRDTTRGELAKMDRFLDSHPEVAEQLRKDPSLVNNKEFVENHPALRQFLQEHPQVREEFRENPNAFMRQENRYDRNEDRRGDGDTTRGELARMDRFLDSHPEVAERLRKDPTLVNNKEFVENHPALQQFLQEHPQVREEFRENPNAFMRQENRYDRHEDTFGRERGEFGERERFRQFLNEHSELAEQLSKNPKLANDETFVKAHPEFGEYLQAHPQMKQSLATDPQAAMTFGTTNGTKLTTTPPKHQ